MNNTRVPTIDDLRVKLCYICREEEHHGSAPEDEMKTWTHPCKCTLIAHEACLLQWISTSQATAGRQDNALKCPQCGARYQLVSKSPGILRLMSSINRTVQAVGRHFTVVCVGGCIAVFTTSIYVVFTGFGAYAFKQIVGDEMYEIMLTSEPSKWPTIAFFNLPLLTVSLIISRFQGSPQIPFLLTSSFFWPAVDPVHPRFRFLESFWNDPKNSQALSRTRIPRLTQWPPSPMTAGLFIFPLVTAFYRRLFSKLEVKLLGGRPKPRPPPRPFAGIDDQIQIRIRLQNQPEEHQRIQRVREGQQAAVDDVRDPIEVAADIVEVDSGAIGRRLGGALLIPAISKAMGNLLFHLSQHSGLLRRFLGVRPPLHGLLPPLLGPYTNPQAWEKLGVWSQIGLGLTLLNGPPIWTEADPVWWRNAIGLGLFVAAKDCIKLVHLWLTKRDLESRRIKNRNFAGVDIKELDLIPSWNAGEA